MGGGRVIITANRMTALRPKGVLPMTDAMQTSAYAFPHKNAFLGAILVLLAANVAILVTEGDYSYGRYTGIVVSLMLLFNHIAFQYQLPGSWSTFAQLIAWTWICIGTLYIGTVVLC